MSVFLRFLNIPSLFAPLSTISHWMVSRKRKDSDHDSNNGNDNDSDHDSNNGNDNDSDHDSNNGNDNDSEPLHLLIRATGGWISEAGKLKEFSPHTSLDMVWNEISKRSLTPKLYRFFPGGQINEYVLVHTVTQRHMHRMF